MTDTCRNGHLRTPDNLYTDSNGHVRCRVCSRESFQRFIAKRDRDAYNAYQREGRRRRKKPDTRQLQLFSTGPLHARIKVLEIQGITREQIAERIGVKPEAVHKLMLRSALSDPYSADRWAIAVRSHPAVLWPEWVAA